MPHSLVEFMKLEPPKVPMLIGRGILPAQGKMIIGAPPKSNKSFIALNMALALSQGRPLFNALYKSKLPIFPVIKQCRTLYIEQENDVHGTQARLKGLLPGEIADLPFFIKTRDTAMRLDTPEGAEVIRAEIAECRPDVVIMDPLAKFNLQDENSAQEMGYVMRVVDHIREDFHCAVVIIHHTKKQNEEYPSRGGDRLRGSSALFADIDTLMEIDRKSGESVREPILQLSFELRHGEPLEPLLFKRLLSGEVVFMGEEFVWGGGTQDRPHRGRSKYDRA